MAFQIEFINHASVLIRSKNVGLLTDPWYKGTAFHKGWNLIAETDDDTVRDVLSRTTHIWVSHEHPDHFSPPFFIKYGDLIRAQKIQLLFQKIEDRRVITFLRKQNFDVLELEFLQPYSLDNEVRVTCLKDEFYDSALSIKVGDKHILNINDCAVTTEERADEIRRHVGHCDVLLTQFSYAAWKGGRENITWRRTAAKEKLNSLSIQARVFQATTVIPFASFAFFSNQRNFYLNDSVNRPSDLVGRFDDAPFELVVMKPGDTFDSQSNAHHNTAQSAAAVAWWDEQYDNLDQRELWDYEPVEEAVLEETFERYCERVWSNNARWFMQLMRWVSPIRVFQPVKINLDDLDATYQVDICAGTFEKTQGPSDLQMSSESLNFIFRNTFGFDTLTVNGCLEESRPDGFSRATRALAIENLNNLGLSFSPSLIIQPEVIMIFLGRLASVRRKQKNAS